MGSTEIWVSLHAVEGLEQEDSMCSVCGSAKLNMQVPRAPE